MEVSGAGIVAEAFPKLEHAVERGVGEVAYGREGGEEAFEVGDDGFDARLLEHDFGEPDAIGVARAAPREVAGGGAIPGEEGAAGAEGDTFGCAAGAGGDTLACASGSD